MTAPGTVSHALPGHLIRRLHQISTQLFLQRVADAGHDLTPVQFAALDAIGHYPGIDQAGLADHIAKDRATTGSVIERLERKRLLVRTVSARDKRARVLTLTEEGCKTVAALLPVVTGLQRDILQGLDEAEYATFVKLAAKAAKQADALVSTPGDGTNRG
ncbi:MarR family winged helix-turn-helix transcriptional regulator [Halodurantibacterium flavum]|uniref:MarR family winged helix-turn-helix transcriptional regulator n=1 Tax=Halodurantibacterium flavum TaxID=1382802 RepID=A0ABW4S830_9RHOB